MHWIGLFNQYMIQNNLKVTRLDIVQDFLIKLGIEPGVRLWDRAVERSKNPDVPEVIRWA